MSARDAIARAMLRRGDPAERVAAVLGVCPTTVSAWRRQWQMPPRQRRPVQAHQTREAVERRADVANDMLLDGRSRAWVCVELGISRRTLERYIRPGVRRLLQRRVSASTRRKAAEHMRSIQREGRFASPFAGRAA
jgi:transposase-like protein